MYAQAVIKPNLSLRNGAYGIVMRGVQKCTCAGDTLRGKNTSRILTPDGLRFICQANDYDPEKIGRHMLEVMARQQSDQTRI